MHRYLTSSVQRIPPSGIRKFFDLVSSSKDIISLGVGEPDFVTPRSMRQAAIHGLEQGRTTYTHNAGLPELREEISAYLSNRFSVSYEPSNEILVTIGGSEAIDVALRALISYSPITSIGGGISVGIKTLPEDNFKLRPDLLEKAISPRSKVLILCYPSNPTGGIMTKEDWEPIARLVEKHDLIVISDEIYAELTYGTDHASFAAVPGMRVRRENSRGTGEDWKVTSCLE